jgi:ABC-type sugar transport system permease subunit
MEGGTVRTSRLTPYLYIAPMILVLTLIFLYPTIEIFHQSLLRRMSDRMLFVGLDNYRLMLADDVFWRAIHNNLMFLASVPILTVVSLFLAVLLHEGTPGWRIYRAIVFLPYVLPVAAISITFSYMYQLHGPLNQIFDALGLSFLMRDWLGDPNLIMPSVISVFLWVNVGFGVIIFLARLMSIDPEIFDAAKVDGASWWQNLIHVTIPQLRGVIQVFLVLEVITVLGWTFTYVYAMTGGARTRTTVMDFYIYETGIAWNLMGIATAAGVLLLVVSLVFIWLQSRIETEEA